MLACRCLFGFDRYLQTPTPGGPEFEGLVAAVHARQEGAVGAFIAELRRRQVPDTIRSAVLEPDHALCKRLDDLMIDLAGNYVHDKK